MPPAQAENRQLPAQQAADFQRLDQETHERLYRIDREMLGQALETLTPRQLEQLREEIDRRTHGKFPVEHSGENIPVKLPARAASTAAKSPQSAGPNTIGAGVVQEVSAAALPVELSLEDNAKAKIGITLEREKSLKKTLPGTMQLDLTAAGGGQHYLYFQCPGYASQWAYVEIVGGKTAQKKIKVELFRKRYVILRCAFNTRGGRNLEGDGVEEQRIALSHWTSPKYFSQD